MAKLTRDASLDLLTTAGTNTHYQNLGTTPTLFPQATSASNFTIIRTVQITNKHLTQGVAFLMSTAASPGLTASVNGSCATTDGTPVLPLAQYFFSYATTAVSGGMNLWLAASAGSTPVSVTVWDKELRG